MFSMTIQAQRNCPGLPGLPARATGILLLRAGLLIYIRPWFNAFKTFKSFKAIPDSPNGLNALNGAQRWNGLNILNQEFVNSEEATRLVHTTREERMSSEIFRFFGASVATMLFVGFALAPTPAPAQGLQCASNPLIGTWRLNLQKSTITRNNGVIEPRIMIIAPFGDNGITEVFINDRDPRLVGRWEMWSVQFDGKPYPTKGGDPRQMRWTRIDCNTFQHETLRQLYYNLPDGTVKEYVPEGRVSSGGRITVSADGKTLTNKHTGTLGNQTRYEDEILVFDRQ